jgi:hypothetical protein
LSSTNAQEITADNVTSFVKPENAMSEKLIQLQAKVLAIEDTMSLVKKSFDKEQIDLTTMLRLIR